MQKKEITFAQKVIEFDEYLANITIDLPKDFGVINPYSGSNQSTAKQVVAVFYSKYYNDNHQRRLILGSSPSRRGSAVTGIPFEDAAHLEKQTGLSLDNFHINQASSNFLYDVMQCLGGVDKFYTNFYMNFVFPLGLTKINDKHNTVNCNYYESKKVLETVMPLIIESLRKQINFGLDTSVCYCIGSGDNYKVLTSINHQYQFFAEIIPLEHPRFIMQYHAKDKELYMDKYLAALKGD